jgi:hypothetical protein
MEVQSPKLYFPQNRPVPVHDQASLPSKLAALGQARDLINLSYTSSGQPGNTRVIEELKKLNEQPRPVANAGEANRLRTQHQLVNQLSVDLTPPSPKENPYKVEEKEDPYKVEEKEDPFAVKKTEEDTSTDTTEKAAPPVSDNNPPPVNYNSTGNIVAPAADTGTFFSATV